MYFSRAIWLGDLNYRISLSYEDTKKLLTENNWDALFEKDQVNSKLLKIEHLLLSRKTSYGLIKQLMFLFYIQVK